MRGSPCQWVIVKIIMRLVCWGGGVPREEGARGREGKGRGGEVRRHFSWFLFVSLCGGDSVRICM